MEPETGIPVVYCARNRKGTKIIAGAFNSRAEAKPYSKKIGMACGFWLGGRYS